MHILGQKGTDPSNFGKWCFQLETIRLKAKGTVCKHCTLVGKVVSQGLTTLKLLYLHTGVEQEGKWTVGGGGIPPK